MTEEQRMQVALDHCNPRPVPAMPTVPTVKKHRQRDLPMLFPACVSRPVSKKEMTLNPKAMLAMNAEWKRLWDKGVWDHTGVREWSDVAREAQRTGKTVHLGRLFGLCVQKGSELPDEDPRKSTNTGLCLVVTTS